MSTALQLVHDGDRAVEIHRVGGGRLLRYVFRPETSLDEAARPYAHPVCTLAPIGARMVINGVMITARSSTRRGWSRAAII